MALAKRLPILALALAAIGCGQGNSGNVMAPQSNALTPAEVDKALQPGRYRKCVEQRRIGGSR